MRVTPKALSMLSRVIHGVNIDEPLFGKVLNVVLRYETVLITYHGQKLIDVLNYIIAVCECREWSVYDSITDAFWCPWVLK